MRVTLATGYFDHDADAITVINALPVPGVGGTDTGLEVQSYEKFEQFSQQVRFESLLDGPINFMVGGYYSHERLQSTTNIGYYFAPFGLNAGAPYTAATPVVGYNPFIQKTDVMSVFGSLSYELSDQATLNLGARYFVADKQVTVRDLIFGSGITPAQENFVPGPASVQPGLLAALGAQAGNYPDPNRSDEKFLPAVNLQYKFTPDIVGYISYSKGFKAGGFSHASTRAEFGPELADAYEIGLKANLFDRRLFVSLAAFRSDYSGLQEATQNFLSSGVVVSSIGNIDSARSQGIEFSSSLRVNDYIALNADLAYLDAKFLDYPNSPCTTLDNSKVPPGAPACIQNMSGKRRPWAPEFSGNAGISVTLPVSDTLEARIDPSVYFTSRFYQSATADPLFEQSGYAKVDLRVGFGPSDRKWEVAVIGKNLTDKKTGSFRNSVAAASGTYWVASERPRSVAFQISIRQ